MYRVGPSLRYGTSSWINTPFFPYNATRRLRRHYATPPRPPPSFSHHLALRIHHHPFLFFGLPFISIIVLGSIALTSFTQTRYDIHDERVKHVQKEEEVQLGRKRRKVSLQEEYWTLMNTMQEDGEYEMKRVQRLSEDMD